MKSYFYNRIVFLCKERANELENTGYQSVEIFCTDEKERADEILILSGNFMTKEMLAIEMKKINQEYKELFEQYDRRRNATAPLEEGMSIYPQNLDDMLEYTMKLEIVDDRWQLLKNNRK